jgi:hypothetical protein
LAHTKETHDKEFQSIVEELRAANHVLNEALEKISDDEDDDNVKYDDQVRLLTSLFVSY